VSRPTVLVTKRLPSMAMARLDEACDVDLNDRDTFLSHDELIARVRGKQGLIAMLPDTVDRAVLEAGLPDLKVVAAVAVGINNIDAKTAAELGIAVTNTPDVLTESTADLTWSLILGIMRRVTEGDRLVRRGGWKAWAFDFMLGTELRGKQLGIVGFGRIGRAVAARAAAFGVRVAYFARNPQASKAGPGEMPAEPMPLDRLLATSDIVSLHCPLTPETRHLIDQTALARMKRSAYLINASRGPVVDEAALAWALKNRLIAGAGLDVYENEPTVLPELMALENVLLCPHLGSATSETRTAMADLAARNIVAVLTGQPPLTPVT
jgi:lactate dehydrogenase-like 2-hydroxyacid dehydrogenase